MQFRSRVLLILGKSVDFNKVCVRKLPMTWKLYCFWRKCSHMERCSISRLRNVASICGKRLHAWSELSTVSEALCDCCELHLITVEGKYLVCRIASSVAG